MPSLGQLKQRLGIMYNLLPLSRLETELYILRQREWLARMRSTFSENDALDEIFTCTKGFPQAINIICE